MLTQPTLGAMSRGMPLSPVSGVKPAGVSTTQTAPTSQALFSPHILTKTASGNPDNPWQAPSSSPSAAAPPPVAPPPAAPYSGSAPVAQAPVSAVPQGAAPQSAAPQAAPVAATNFGPGHDLLNTQINPSNPGVNRTELAQKTIADWDAQHAPELAAQQRTIGQNAAKFGRIGAGMTTNDLTGAEATYNRDRMAFGNQLASGLASDTIGDQRANNNELRTERDYQTGRSDKATSDAIEQRNQEEQLLNSGFGRALSTAQFGYGGSPVDTLSGFSGALGQSGAASTGAGIDLMSGRNKQQPFDFSSLLKYIPQAGTATPSAIPNAAPAKPIVRNF